jgi:maltooligosyltrehalose synthase
MWDFSLVDPDNRRPVDYVSQHHMLQELQAQMAAARDDQPTLAVAELVAHFPVALLVA